MFLISLFFIGLIDLVLSESCGSVVLNGCESVDLISKFTFSKQQPNPLAKYYPRLIVSGVDNVGDYDVNHNAAFTLTGNVNNKQAYYEDGLCAETQSQTGFKVLNCPAEEDFYVTGTHMIIETFAVTLQPQTGQTTCRNITVSFSIDDGVNAPTVCLEPLRPESLSKLNANALTETATQPYASTNDYETTGAPYEYTTAGGETYAYTTAGTYDTYDTSAGKTLTTGGDTYAYTTANTYDTYDTTDTGKTLTTGGDTYAYTTAGTETYEYTTKSGETYEYTTAGTETYAYTETYGYTTAMDETTAQETTDAPESLTTTTNQPTSPVIPVGSCGVVTVNECRPYYFTAAYRMPSQTSKPGNLTATMARFVVSSRHNITWHGSAFTRKPCDHHSSQVCGYNHFNTTACPRGAGIAINALRGQVQTFTAYIEPDASLSGDDCLDTKVELTFDQHLFEGAATCATPLKLNKHCDVPESTTHVPVPTEPETPGSCGSVIVSSCEPHYFEAVYQLPKKRAGDDTTAVQTRFTIRNAYGLMSSWQGAANTRRCSLTGFDSCEAGQYVKNQTECPQFGVSMNGDGLQPTKFFAAITPNPNMTDCSNTVVHLQLDSIFNGPAICLSPLKEIEECAEASTAPNSESASSTIFGLGMLLLVAIVIGICLCCCSVFGVIVVFIMQSNKKAQPKFERV